MTKKDYELIAKAIRLQVDYNIAQSKRMTASEKYRLNHVDYYVENGNVALNLATLLQEHDPKFNRSKFLQACGLEA
jgi:hypothetical protein